MKALRASGQAVVFSQALISLTCRVSACRWALLRNMVTDLIKHERIQTTVPKAKEASMCSLKHPMPLCLAFAFDQCRVAPNSFTTSMWTPNSRGNLSS